MNKDEVRARWTTADGEWRHALLVKALLGGPSSAEALLRHTSRTEEALIDLRGLALPEGSHVKGRHFAGLDLSYAALRHAVVESCALVGVRLRGADATGLIERSSSFRDVDLEGAALTDTGIGMGPSHYHRVSFRRANFSGASFLCGSFEHCDFSHARLRKLDFHSSRFEYCTFAGRIESVWFNRQSRFPSDRDRCGNLPPNTMHEVDFSVASLWDVTFTGGLDLSTVRLPTDGLHHRVRRFDVALKRARDELPDLPWEAEVKRQAGIWIDALLVHARTQPMWIINEREFCDQVGELRGRELVERILDHDRATSGANEDAILPKAH